MLRRVVDALADLRDRDTLLALLLDTTVGASKRVTAGTALAKLGDRRGTDAMDAPHASFAGSAQADAHWLRFGRALNTLGNSRGADILPGLARDYPNVSYYKRTGLDAAHALTQSSAPRAADMFAALAKQTIHPEWRLAALTALAGLGDPRGADLLHATALSSGRSGEGRLGPVSLTVYSAGRCGWFMVVPSGCRPKAASRTAGRSASGTVVRTSARTWGKSSSSMTPMCS